MDLGRGCERDPVRIGQLSRMGGDTDDTVRARGMSKGKIGFAVVVAATGLGLAVAGCQKQPSGETATQPAGEREGPKTLTIWWAQWAPADGLQALAEEFGRKENVTVKVHQIPWSSFQDQVFQEFGKPNTCLL